MKIQVKTSFDAITIYFDDLPFLFIKRDEFIGYQSWLNGGDRHFIEFYTKTQKILTEYFDKKRWITILKQLEKLTL